MTINLKHLQYRQTRIRGEHWFKLICAGRAAEGLRAKWQQQLRMVQKEIGFSHIRFHGLFHDEMMVCKRKNDETLQFNFRYIDQLFDFLLEINLKPFLELGFMPSSLASDETTLFWWQAHVSPPRVMDEWVELVMQFFYHCIERYGLDEVRSWYVEIWNEPCILGEFWSGTQQDYFKLYEASARAIKKLDPEIRVGGPSSAFFTDGKAPWMEEFLDFVDSHNVPIDFVTMHPYPVWWEAGEFSESAKIYYRGLHATAEDLQALKKLLLQKDLAHLEVHVTEWNSSFLCRDAVHDTAFKAPFIVDNCLETEGMTDSLGYWVFTDLFEEHGAGDSLFHGGFGLLTENGLKKAAYWGYWFLRKLGNHIIDTGKGYAVSRNGDGYRVLLWNAVEYREGYTSSTIGQPENPYLAFEEKDPLEISINFDHLVGNVGIVMHIFTRENHSLFDNWVRLGSPEHPSVREMECLEKSSRPDVRILPANKKKAIDCVLAPFQLILLEITGAQETHSHRVMAKNNEEATR